MKAKDMRAKSDKELQNELTKQQEKLGQLHVDYRTKEVKNIREIRVVKRSIARILTIQNEKQLQGETK